jgi:hypothetical protein
MAKLIIERGKKWQISELSPKTIALDGAVEGPYLDAENEIFSFDHHGNCIRGITLSTCEQVRDFIALGLDVTGYSILLNDIDLDSALSAWLLTYPIRTQEPIVEKLIHMAGRQDAHAGAYPIKESEDILDFIAEPETKMRKDTSYQNCSNEVLMFVLEAIWRRIEQYADGKLPDLSKAKDSQKEDYEVVKKGTNWRLVKMNGERSLRGLARDNVNRYVGFRKLSHGEEGNSLSVTIARRSEVVTGFPVGPATKKGTILWALNQAEPKRDGRDDDWGGTSTIGGSPRNSDGKGSFLEVNQIFEIVEKVVLSTLKDPSVTRETSVIKKSRSKSGN